MKFSVIVADCPWSFVDHLKNSDVKRGASSNYSTMSVDQIADIPVRDISDPTGSVLALWTPASLLWDGLVVMNAWGFHLKQCWVWVKVKKGYKTIQEPAEMLSFGLGRLGRNCNELVLIGTQGKIYNKLKDRSQRTVFFAPNEKHSKKPEILQDRLELMFKNEENKRLEMFARRERKGWVCLGNECPGTINEDINISIEKLKGK
jgi:N6-adenosine-specific RNA methylase IME4